MLAGKPFSALLRVYREEWPEDKTYWTEFRHVQRLLSPVDVRLRPARYAKSIGGIRSRALVAIHYKPRQHHWHWVVIDPSHSPNIVFDPRSKRVNGRRDLASMRPGWYHTVKGT